MIKKCRFSLATTNTHKKGRFYMSFRIYCGNDNDIIVHFITRCYYLPDAKRICKLYVDSGRFSVAFIICEGINDFNYRLYVYRHGCFIKSNIIDYDEFELLAARYAVDSDLFQKFAILAEKGCRDMPDIVNFAKMYDVDFFIKYLYPKHLLNFI